jgi:hypothetical protein
MAYLMAQLMKVNTQQAVAVSQIMTQLLNVLIVVGRGSTLTILGVIKQSELQTGEKMESKKEIKMVELKDTSAMSEVERDAYAQEVWEKLTGKKVKKEPK